MKFKLTTAKADAILAHENLNPNDLDADFEWDECVDDDGNWINVMSVELFDFVRLVYLPDDDEFEIRCVDSSTKAVVVYLNNIDEHESDVAVTGEAILGALFAMNGCKL